MVTSRRGRFYRFYDLDVAGAPAQVARNALFDFVIRGILCLIKECLGRHDHAGRAETALHCTVLDKGLLQGMELSIGICKTLDRGDASPLRLEGRQQAGIHGLSVHDHGAGTALAVSAPEFGARELKHLPQHVEQRPRGVNLHPYLFTIKRKLHLFFHIDSS